MTEEKPATQEDAAAYMQMANAFLRIANQADGELHWIAAAFIHACSRYNGFALQSQGGLPGEIDDEVVDYLRGCFETELRRHMAETLTRQPASVRPDPMPGDTTVVLLDRVARMDGGERKEFVDLADRYIGIANSLVARDRPSRISSACMHACARFMICVLQMEGLKPETTDENAVVKLAGAYERQLRDHMAQTLRNPSA